MDTAIVVVTFHPDADVVDRLLDYVGQSGRLIVVDNASGKESQDMLRRFASTQSNIELVFNSCNLGIAAALNQGIQCAANCGASWVLTMDQDSSLDSDCLSNLLGLVAKFEPSDKVGTLAANYIDSTGTILDSTSVGGDSAHCVQSAITSGSLVKVQAWEEVGGFREDFFIDCVDHDFCFRLRRKKWKIYLTDKPLMKHRLGNPYRIRVLWKTLAVPNYPPIRRYYMTRNRIVLFKSHWLYESMWVTGQLLHILGDGLRIIAHERDRVPKLLAMIRGVRDGLYNKMGP